PRIVKFIPKIVLFIITGLVLSACGDDDSGNKNTPPAVGDLTFSIAENVPTGTVVETVEATDEEKDALSFAITEGNTNEAFAINADLGQLVTAKLLDFETTPNYTLTISVSDGKLSGSADITINVTDVNEAPTITEQTFVVAEDAPDGTTVGTVQATDPEEDELTFAITAGNTGDVFDIDQTTGAITTAASLDFETAPTYTLTISVSDGNLSTTADIIINVTDVNEDTGTSEPINTAPTITEQTFTVAEDAVNGATVGTVQASDAETNNLTFAITAGNTGNAFAIAEGTGAITKAGTLDFENNPNYTLNVSVSDGNLSATADITINLTNINEAPAITPAQTFSVAEDAVNGTAVGTVLATDPEEDNLMFSITQGNTGNVFAIGEGTGAITTAGALDFENNPNYTLKVSVSDGELADEADITINVTNVNDNAPTIVDQTFTVAEDAANNTAVGIVQAADADMNNLTFAITSGNTGNVFDINRTTGAITTAGTLDFENNPNYYTLTVKVSDGKLSGTANITINVVDFKVSSTNNTINIDGLANVYTVDVETTLMNWTITSSDYAIIPDAEIQKLGDKRFLMVVGGYNGISAGTDRNIMLTVSGTGGGSDLVITVNQTKNTVASRNAAGFTLKPLRPMVIELRKLHSDSDEHAWVITTFEVNGMAHPFTFSVSPPESIRLRDHNPVEDGNIVHFHLMPPSGGRNTYAIVTATSDNNDMHKIQLVIILQPPSGG
ncbi:MAG: cadherin repeat domain-containing protein, partial [Ekhidna sp.]|nr:cadherin repeat domain-containing protein [Ekhidna sp.]